MLNRRARGFTIIELGITLVIVGILITLALPAFRTFLQNTQIRSAAETTLAGLNLARAEAVRRNQSVRFTLVSSLTSSCAASTSALNWVVSLSSPAGLCDVAPSESTAPQIVQKKSAQDGSPNVTVSATGGATVIFNGLGRVSGSGTTQIDFSNPGGGTCEHVDSTNGTMRCLRVMISTGGQVKMCDPKVTGTDDPRRCA